MTVNATPRRRYKPSPPTGDVTDRGLRLVLERLGPRELLRPAGPDSG